MDSKKAPAKKTEKKTELVEMKHRITGQSAMVHPSMIDEYKKGEYVEVH